jgi:hypothetical protein
MPEENTRERLIRQTVAWYKRLWKARSKTGDILDADPGSRIIWTEVLAHMRYEGFQGDAVLLREDWQCIYDEHLRKWEDRETREERK